MTADIDLDRAVEAVEALSKVDWSKISAAIASPSVIGTLTTAEDIASFVAQFVPEAVYVGDAAKVLILIEEARQADLWAPGQVEDPAMQHADGPREPGMGEP